MTTITSVVCSINAGVLSVAVTWDVLATGTLTVYNSAGLAITGSNTSSTYGQLTWQPANGAMISGQAYTAQVLVNGATSQSVYLLWTAPTNLNSSNDGQQVSLSWVGGGAPTPGLYNIRISDGTNTVALTTATTTLLYTPSPSLSSTVLWTYTVTPTLDISTGPIASGTIIPLTVAVSEVTCVATNNGTDGLLEITPAATTFTSFIGTLTCNGVALLTQALSYVNGTPMSMTLGASVWPLSTAGGYQISLQASTVDASGPSGSALAVLGTAPQIQQASLSSVSAPILQMVLALPPGSPSATGFTATLMQDGVAQISASFIGNSGSLTLPSAIGSGVYQLRASANYGENSSSPLAQLTLLSSAPLLSAIENDGVSVAVSYTAASDSNTSLLELALGGVVVSSVLSQASPAYLPAPAIGVPFSVSVRAVSGGLAGPICGPVAMICAAPSAQGVSYDLSSVASLSWLAPTTAVLASGYQIATYDGAKLLNLSNTGNSNTTAVLASNNFVVGGSISAQVRASSTDADTGASLLGPASARVPVLNSAPGQLQVSYDGGTASVTWAAPAGPQVNGYLVTFTDTTGAVATVSQRLAGTHSTLSYATVSTSIVNVAVQASGANALGLASSTPLFTPALFLSTDTLASPYLAPSASLNFGKQALALYLPNLLTAATSPLPSNTSFSLSTTTTAPWTYLLTVNQTDAVWSFDASAIRAALLADITDFFTQMSAQGLTAQGDLLLRQALARILPLTFVETLFYAYNFNVADGGAGQGQGLIDLTPGLALRVEVESYQVLPTAYASGNAGVTGGAVFDYDVASYRSGNTWRLGFDAFLSRLVDHGVLFPGPFGGTSTPEQSGAGGSPDFYYPNFLQAYYRLIFPNTFLSSYESAKGSVVSQNLRNNVTMIAAATRAELDSATTVLQNPSNSFQAVKAVYFRGRCLVSVRLHILLNGVSISVPLGTTVANILDRYAAQAAAGGRSAQLRMWRGLDGVAVQGWPTGLSSQIRLDWTPGCTWGDGTTWLDLPLLHGDRLELDLASGQ